MEKTMYLPRFAIKFDDLLAKREGVVTALVTLCGILAISLGIVWLFLRKEPLLFAVLGFGACYLIGRNFWKFRSRGFSVES
jgi:hypothetical protein